MSDHAAFAQVSAEKEAWKLAEAHGLDLVTVLPNFNLGPALSRQETKGLSVGFMKVTALPCKSCVAAVLHRMPATLCCALLHVSYIMLQCATLHCIVLWQAVMGC